MAGKIVVLGAGPVGCAAALMMEKLGYSVDIFEGRDFVPFNLLESFAVGLNPRAFHTFDLIDAQLAQEVLNAGSMIDGWHIYSGTRRVAAIPSGTVIGHSRGRVNHILLEYIKNKPNIAIHWGHKLERVDFDAKTLHFLKNGEPVVVDASSSRVLAADGVWSIARRDMEKKYPGVAAEMKQWNVKFRMLYSKPGASAPGLDRKIHYPMGEIYVCAVEEDRWALGVGIKEGFESLEANEDTEANIAFLKNHVATRAPLAVPLVEEEEYREFFKRKIFEGAICKVHQLNADEWMLLMGDAAKAVIPPTGEGINSGLEDCSVLFDILKEDNEHAFERYNQVRMRDHHGLHALAAYFNDGFEAKGSEMAARLMTMITIAMGKKMGIYKNTYDDFTFGKDATKRVPYGDIAEMWTKQMSILPYMRNIVAPFAAVGRLFRRS